MFGGYPTRLAGVPGYGGGLKALKSRYKLAVISNVDDDLFVKTAEGLGVEFDVVVTAEQVGSYKPDLRNFNVAYGADGRREGAVAARRGESLPRHWACEPAWHRECVGEPGGPWRRDAAD